MSKLRQMAKRLPEKFSPGRIEFQARFLGKKMAGSHKERIIKYILVALIAAFFVIPLFLVCFFECNFNPPAKKIASALLFFFR
jgi:hypothetical protein